MTDPAAQISNLSHIRKFITAGNALFTIRSKKTGDRKTFLVEAKIDDSKSPSGCFFVKLLVGPENTSNYRYLGFMFPRDGKLLIKLNKEQWGKESYEAFCWILRKINGIEPGTWEQAEFWHAGRCGRCGRTLTTPESIELGLGPVCAGM